MRYQDAIEYIIDRDGYSKGFVANPFAGDEVAALGLRRTRALLDLLGQPDTAYRIVHVAGTKGKGSTCAMTVAIARAAGWSVGLYATPHLHTFRERIMLDGNPVSEQAFAALTSNVADAVEALARDAPELGPPTAFEIVTVMALQAFADARVDLAVVEVGLGGRLDATNVVTPDVAAITSISFDHSAILGNTLAEIAAEKGGIIKPGRPVVIGPQQQEALDTLQRIAGERNAPASRAGTDWTTASTPAGARLAGPWGEWNDVQIALAGDHQVENAGLAIAACWTLDPDDLGTETVVRAGLSTVVWPGRFETVGHDPDVIVDGAHNVDSIERLAQTLASRSAGKRIAIIFGVASDKDLPGMLDALSVLDPDLIATASHNPRAVDPHDIARAAGEAGIRATTAAELDTALAAAKTLAGPEGVVCVTGSLYVVAEAREALRLAETPDFERSLLYR